MADGAKPPKGPEVAVPKPEVIPESTPQNPTGQRIEVAGEVTAQKSKEYLNLEKLKRGDFEMQTQEPEIHKIDVKESAEKQRPLLEELAGTTMFELIPDLLAKGIPKEKIANFEIFRHPPNNIDAFLTVANPQGTLDLKAAFQKIQETLSGPNGDDTVRTVLEENWGKMIEFGLQAYAVTEPLLKETSKRAPRAQAERKEKGFFEKHGNSILIGLGLIAGAYVCTSIWHKFTATDEEKTADAAEAPSGFFGKLFKGIAGVGIIGAIFAGLGRLMDTDRVRGWLRRFGFDDAKLIEAFRLLSHGKFSEAWDKLTDLFSDSPEKSNYEKIAAQINSDVAGAQVTSENIQKVSDIKFRAWFPKTGSERTSKAVADTARRAIKSLMPTRGFIAAFVQDDPTLVRDMKSVESFVKLEKNQTKLANINPGPDMKMKEVLEKLCDVTPINAPEKKGLPEAEVAVAGGALGAAAHEAAIDTQTTLGRHQQEVLADIDTDQQLSEDSSEVVQKDVAGLLSMIETAQGESTNWWTREKAYWRKLVGTKTGVEYDEQDFLALDKQLEDMKQTDILTLQDIRTQASTLRQNLQNLEPPVTAEKMQGIRAEIDDFYTHYHALQGHLEEVHQKRIQDDQEAAREGKDASQVFEKGVALGQFTGNTFLGMPFSVMLNEDNGHLVTTIGEVQFGLFAAGGIYYGLLKEGGGGITRGIAGGTKLAIAPAWYGTKYILKLTPGVAEKLKLYESNSIIRQVQRGEITVAEGMTRIEEYLNAHELTYKKVGSKIDGVPPTKKTIGQKVWGTTLLTGAQRRKLEKDMQRLEKLEAQGIRILGEFKPEEEDLIAAQMEKLRRNPAVPKGDEIALRQLAVEALQNEGRIRSLDGLATNLETEGSKLSTLTENADKIETLRQASKNSDNYLEMSIAHIKKMRADGKPETEVEAFTTTVQANLRRLRDRFGTTFGELNAAAVGKKMTTVDRKAFEKLTTQELANATGVRGVLREVKGRGKWAVAFGVANIVLETYAMTKENKEEHVKNEVCKIVKEVGLDTLQLVVDILSPLGLSDWYTVFWGKEAITQRKVGWGERATRVVFGTYNTTADILGFVGGGITAEVGGAGGVAIFAAEDTVEAALRGAGKAPEIIKAVKSILPRIMALGKDVGGFKELLKILKSEKILSAIRETHKVADFAQKGILAYDATKMAIAGYDIFFSTDGQPTYETDFGATQ